MPIENNEAGLAWSIGFSDAVRSEITPSRSRTLARTVSLRSADSTERDSLLGSSGAIVGLEFLAAPAQTIPAEGKIRGTLLLTLAATAVTAELPNRKGRVDLAAISSIDPFSAQSKLALSGLALSTNQTQSLLVL